MNHDAVRHVQESFKALLPIADEVGPMFYARLFETHPNLRPMFAADIQPQARKLVQILAVVVGSLHKLETILPAVKDLARRHSNYGVVDAHYPVVGETLLWTLQEGLGEAFTPAVKQAWANAFETLSSVMIAAAKEPVVA